MGTKRRLALQRWTMCRSCGACFCGFRSVQIWSLAGLAKVMEAFLCRGGGRGCGAGLVVLPAVVGSCLRPWSRQHLALALVLELQLQSAECNDCTRWSLSSNA